MKKLLFAIFMSLILIVLASCSDNGVQPTKEVELVQLSDLSIMLYEGQTYQLVATAIPLDADNVNFIWSSSHSEVCSVNNGLVTALSEGVSVVTVKAENGRAATVRVKVEKYEKVNSIIFSSLELSLEPGQNEVIEASLRPTSNSSDFPIVWSSSNDSVATVDSNGTVTARGPGACLIFGDIGEFARAICRVSVGDAEYLDFSDIVDIEMDGIPSNYVKKDYQGNAIVTGEIKYYEAERILTTDGKMQVYLKLHGIKTFDIDGPEGTGTLNLKALVYENVDGEDVHRLTYTLTSGEVKEGEEFEFKVLSYSDSTGASAPIDEFAFAVEIKPHQRFVKIVLESGEEENTDEFD